MNKNQVYQQISELQRQLDNLKKEIQDMPNYGDCAIKRGAWVRDKRRNVCFKFGHIEKDGRIYDIAGVLRLATLGGLDIMSHEDIEEYLQQEAIKRRLCGWRKFRWPKSSEVSVINAGGGFEYLPDADALTVDVGKSYRRAIYHDGEWAIPVFAELPKTTEDLKSIIETALLEHKLSGVSATEFLYNKGYIV